MLATIEALAVLAYYQNLQHLKKQTDMTKENVTVTLTPKIVSKS